jgi:hypothetical protein
VSFFREAWHAGAREYGTRRAEQYGRLARFGAFVGFLLMAVLGIGIYLAWNGLLGG